eukprot:TRINITY_DN5121_c1_g1_i2.p1 TRINITY_DN5121_c1_g1~~TRINITY_DN5121_c1_g1_i2.p1  ORF type:complete len:270 (-),score=30.68 TRINITY_DN5121_c1_g1_i2:746-1555(-)
MDTPVVLQTAMYLRMEDLARWRTVDTETKKTFDIEGDENAWRYCAQAQFPLHKLFVTFEVYERSQRQLCFAFHSLYQRANYMMSSDPLFVEDIKDAALIERRLREAFRVCSAHRAASGRDAHVVLGSFCLRGENETLFQFGGDGMPAAIAGLPPGVLAIKIRVDAGNLMTQAAYGVVRGNVIELCQEAANVQLAFNLSSAHRDVSAAYLDVPFVLDGCWRSGKCTTGRCRVTKKYTGWPVLCVVTLRVVATCEAPPNLVNALHLESRSL